MGTGEDVSKAKYVREFFAGGLRLHKFGVA